jgi:hypothetical protein
MHGTTFTSPTTTTTIRKISADNGIVTTIAGSGIAGPTGDGGPAATSDLNNPMGVADGASAEFAFLEQVHLIGAEMFFA